MPSQGNTLNLPIPVPVSDGGTSNTSLITTPTASTIPAWDSNVNLSTNNVLYNATVVNGNTTPNVTLTLASSGVQIVTGTASTVTFTLPAIGSTAPLGTNYTIINSTNSTTVKINNSSGLEVVNLAAVGNQGIGTNVQAFYQPTQLWVGNTANFVYTITTDNGNAIALQGDIMLQCANSCGASVQFVGSSSTVNFLVTSASPNFCTMIGAGCGNASSFGLSNTAFGYTCASNTGAGSDFNAMFGSYSGFENTGSNNAYFGYRAGYGNNGSNNTMCGSNILGVASITGSGNIFLGYNIGNNFTTNESNNILIGNSLGTVGDNDVIRIGVPGTHTAFYTAGITSVSVSNQTVATINSSTGQMGNATLTSTGGTVAITNTAGNYNFETSTDKWVHVTATGNLTQNSSNSVIASTTVTLTLPASPTLGGNITVLCNTSHLVTITANTGQTITFGNQSTSTAGSIVNTEQYDCITLMYDTTGTGWIAISAIGNWTT